jgi:hypothetical protein
MRRWTDGPAQAYE